MKTTYARMIDGVAIDVTTEDPKTIFHPDIAVQFVQVPDGTGNGDRHDGENWDKYVSPTVTAVPARAPTVTPPQFKLLLLEDLPQIIEAAKSDIMASTFLDIVNDPRLTEVDMSLKSVQDGLKYCLKQIGMTDEQINTRMVEILSGVWS